jgi:8-oxo-dGTP diphosphatase
VVAGLSDADWAPRFPRLFGRQYLEYADCEVTFTVEPFADQLIARVHVVAVTPDDAIVVCRSAVGWRFLPGGTREPGERVPELVARELREEAGARLLDVPRLFATHVADSFGPEPYRPHLPHPRSCWAYAVARVDGAGTPTNPPDGEEVVEVLALPVPDAVAFLDVEDEWSADVVRLAAAMGLIA